MTSHAGQLANCPARYIIVCPETAIPLFSGDRRSARRIIGRLSQKGKLHQNLIQFPIKRVCIECSIAVTNTLVIDYHSGK